MVLLEVYTWRASEGYKKRDRKGTHHHALLSHWTSKTGAHYSQWWQEGEEPGEDDGEVGEDPYEVSCLKFHIFFLLGLQFSPIVFHFFCGDREHSVSVEHSLNLSFQKQPQWPGEAANFCPLFYLRSIKQPVVTRTGPPGTGSP